MFQGGEVCVHLLRQLTQMAALERTHPLLLFVEPLLGFAKLDLEKLLRTGRLAFPRLYGLVDVEGREGVRDARDGARVGALITDREGHRGLALASLQAFQLHALELEFDVAAHALNDSLERDSLPQIGVETEAVDQSFQSGTAQDFLADR